jgi:hypothetical protein
MKYSHHLVTAQKNIDVTPACGGGKCQPACGGKLIPKIHQDETAPHTDTREQESNRSSNIKQQVVSSGYSTTFVSSFFR